MAYYILAYTYNPQSTDQLSSSLESLSQESSPLSIINSSPRKASGPITGFLVSRNFRFPISHITPITFGKFYICLLIANDAGSSLLLLLLLLCLCFSCL